MIIHHGFRCLIFNVYNMNCVNEELCAITKEETKDLLLSHDLSMSISSDMYEN